MLNVQGTAIWGVGWGSKMLFRRVGTDANGPNGYTTHPYTTPPTPQYLPNIFTGQYFFTASPPPPRLPQFVDFINSNGLEVYQFFQISFWPHFDE